MSIPIGTQVGSFEITALLGKGGMGEVYRARDPKLKRDVAIKILPDEFSRDPDRASRFQREAEVLATLNHTNIAAIYDLQEANGCRFLVLELVEGETLADRIARGRVPLEEALVIAKQVADALEAAHEKGIIHRDLKPANIKISPDGKVKVLDFGLAKAFDTAPAGRDLSNSPTLSMAATNAGVILGTAAYMSPEQARGKAVDKRIDIWAFGCVLYEMLTGERAFDGEEMTDVLAAVIRAEPDWRKLPAETPRAIRQLLRRCLEKDRTERLPDIAMARIEIKDALSAPAQAEPMADSKFLPQPLSPNRVRLAWSVTALLAVALGATFVIWPPWRAAPPAAPLRLSAELGSNVSLATNAGANSTLAVSPDGSVLAFVGTNNNTRQIYIRQLGQLQATPLAGTTGAASPFFSPDGEWLAFFADGKLKKISVTGGAAVTLCDAPNGRGGAWGDDDNIVFSPDTGGNISLQRVSSAGGKPEALTKLGQGEVSHRWPQVLPGAKAVLYVAGATLGAWDNANIIVQALPAGVAKVIVRGGYYPRYLTSGHIVYIHDGTLFAAPFDLDRLEVIGQPVPAVEGVTSAPPTGSAQIALSGSGTLAYLPGQSAGFSAPILWMNHDGKTTPLRSIASDWSNPHFGPDGQKLAFDSNDGRQNDVWVYEWARDTLTRLTFDPGDHRKPVWTPDGRRIVFTSVRETAGKLNLYWQRADGRGEIQRLTESPNNQYPASWHPTGKYLAFSENNPQTRDDLMILPLEGDEKSGWKPGKPIVFLNSPAAEVEPMFSPDGRWIAYQSNESGRVEVFVRPFPGPGGKWQISTAGGDQPTWSHIRRELFYRTPDYRIMVASYSVEGDSFKADKPRLWSEQPILQRFRQRFFNLHPDGERLVVAAATGPQAEEKRDKIVLFFNFFDELRRIAPASKR